MTTGCSCARPRAVLLAFADDLGVTPMLLADGEYDRPFTAFLATVLHRGDVAVDVGANIGIFTLAMGRAVGLTGRVVAYEPNPEVAELLAGQRLPKRGTGDRLRAEVRSAGGGRRRATGTASLIVRPKHRGMGTLADTDVGPPRATRCPRGRGGHAGRRAGGGRRDPAGEDRRGGRGARRAPRDAAAARQRRVRFVDLELIDRHAGPAWAALGRELRRLQAELGGRFHTIGSDGSLHALDVEATLHHDELGHVIVELPAG